MYVLSCAVSEISRSIGQIVTDDRGGGDSLSLTHSFGANTYKCRIAKFGRKKLHCVPIKHPLLFSYNEFLLHLVSRIIVYPNHSKLKLA